MQLVHTNFLSQHLQNTKLRRAQGCDVAEGHLVREKVFQVEMEKS